MKEIFFRKKLILFGIILLAVFLRFYKLSDLMIFGGDVARDYLVARDITLKGILPLLGSPSSVPWLHQGAFFTYILGIVLWIGKYNPLSGAYFSGGMGVLSVFLIYLVGKKFFDEKTGFFAAFFYSVSPLVVIFDRYPYHQSLISLFTILFFLSLFLSIDKNKNFFVLSSFLLGLLLQLELSNLVLMPILFVVFLDYRQIINFKLLIFSLFAFIFTWLPKIIYDFSNGFTQTLGFVAWIVHKILPLKILSGEQGLAMGIIDRINTIFDYLSKLIFWNNNYFSIVILGITFLLVFGRFDLKKRKANVSLYLLFLWVLIPFLGFIIQGSPSGAYIPVFFAVPALLIGKLFKKDILSVVFLVLIVVFNVFTLITNDYFMMTGTNDNLLKARFNMGQSYKLQKQTAEYIINDSKGKNFNLDSLGSHAIFPSAKLDLVYLTWYFGNEPKTTEENIKYFIINKGDNLKLKPDWQVTDFPYMLVAKINK